ncbi:hypothetical protein FRB96_002154 [Tulasnella sp. 330]|nr:hypothetical protein FRB96_002154 [Tulasnella sp. 330]KAG8871397.1 hypothetical protein FRB97_008728 [Tulasnella sp. 331]
MGALCPNLKHLWLEGQGIGEDAIGIASQTIGQLCRLETVMLSSQDPNDVTEILLKMAELPALESVSLESLRSFPSQWPPSSLIPFPKLKKLLVRRPWDSGIEAFLHHLAIIRSHLTELELGEGYGSSTPDLKRTMTLAGEHQGLESLVVYSKRDIAPLIIDMLQPILQCRSLTILKLRHGGAVRMKDGDVEILASCLYKLEHLTLVSCWDEVLPSFTLRALSILVALCPYLETLTLAVDARQPLPREQLVHGAPHQRLRELSVGRSPVSEELDDIAYFMSGLSDVEGFRILSRSSILGLWDKVEAALPAMRVKRVAERDAVHRG